ncbi:MAG: MBL fold metallo-hydrolase [Candidatus Azambacteria bacterium]|nr:MBL fold metallo-hydrolase [Candidatus Azambacteria bacterium]
MQITWYGQACFKITSGDTTIVISPFGRGVGLNPPRGKADVVLLSGDGSDSDVATTDSGVVISGEGEYEVQGVLINGFSFFYAPEGTATPRKSTVYTIVVEGMTLCHLDNAMPKQVDAILEEIGDVDVLMVPVGGTHHIGKEEVRMLDAEAAVALVGKIEPRVVIPMYYKVPGLTISLNGVDAFLRAMGSQHDTTPVDKVTLKKKDLPQDETKVVVLSTS